MASCVLIVIYCIINPVSKVPNIRVHLMFVWFLWVTIGAPTESTFKVPFSSEFSHQRPASIVLASADPSDI